MGSTKAWAERSEITPAVMASRMLGWMVASSVARWTNHWAMVGDSCNAMAMSLQANGSVLSSAINRNCSA